MSENAYFFSLFLFAVPFSKRVWIYSLLCSDPLQGFFFKSSRALCTRFLLRLLLVRTFLPLHNHLAILFTGSDMFWRNRIWDFREEHMFTAIPSMTRIVNQPNSTNWVNPLSLVARFFNRRRTPSQHWFHYRQSLVTSSSSWHYLWHRCRINSLSLIS